MTIIIPERLAALDTLSLDNGSHGDFDQGHCALEVVSYLAGEPHSDSPKCVALPIRSFVVNWNDSLPSNEERDRLIRPLIPDMIGTAGGDSERCGYLALDWLVREFLPTWLDLVPSLADHAARLRMSPEVTDLSSAKSVGTIVRAASTAASAARAAARAAAWDAAWDAARAAAWDAAWAAARDAARAAAWDAARAAAWDAAKERLAPTTAKLQASAQDLVRRMCAVCKEQA